MTPDELKERTYTFALRVARLLQEFPLGVEASTIGPQLLRAAAGVASNYRAACRGRSRRDFVSKIGVAIEEADESDFWLRFAVDLDLLKVERAQPLRSEADELLAILTSSRKTAAAKLRPKGKRDGAKDSQTARSNALQSSIGNRQSTMTGVTAPSVPRPAGRRPPSPRTS